MDIEKIKNKLNWDFKLADEFKTNDHGYTFIIEVYDNVPCLSLYRFSPVGSKSEPLEKQPPETLLRDALKSQNNCNIKNGSFCIDKPLKNWIEENILK